jgi:hypothetical protein
VSAQTEVAIARVGLFDIRRLEAIGKVTSFNGDYYRVEVKITDALTVELNVATDNVEYPEGKWSLDYGDEVMVIFRG